MSVGDDLVAVLLLACLTEDRTNEEQHALLRLAAKLDNERNAQTVTNRRGGPASRLLELVEGSRLLDKGQRAVALPAKQRASWAKRAARWDAEGGYGEHVPQMQDVAVGEAL